jgi:hypothetical protein
LEPELDDPIWDYILQTHLMPYLPAVRKWWADVENFSLVDTGVVELDYPGLYVRFTRAAVRSPIKNVQAFPFVPTGRLQITNVTGGVSKMVMRVCLNGRFKIDEFTIISKSNLPSTFNQAQFVAFIPTDIYEGSRHLGRWIYLTTEELNALSIRVVLDSTINKIVDKI